MASPSKHLVLTPNQVATVTLDAGYDTIEVLSVNANSTDLIYFTYGGTSRVPDNPTIMGDGTIILLAAQNGVTVKLPADSGVAVVKLISAGSPQISVRGY